jgi:hypothetical protein
MAVPADRFHQRFCGRGELSENFLGTKCGRVFTIRPHFDVCGERVGMFTVVNR